jgi:hypothetical protein
MLYKITAEVWLYPAPVAWHFVTIPPKVSAEIKARFAKQRVGWGSIPVTVTLGKTIWKTSIFPDKKSSGYLLPLKANIRKKEGIEAGKTVSFALAVGAQQPTL